MIVPTQILVVVVVVDVAVFVVASAAAVVVVAVQCFCWCCCFLLLLSLLLWLLLLLLGVGHAVVTAVCLSECIRLCRRKVTDPFVNSAPLENMASGPVLSGVSYRLNPTLPDFV